MQHQHSFEDGSWLMIVLVGIVMIAIGLWLITSGFGIVATIVGYAVAGLGIICFTGLST